MRRISAFPLSFGLFALLAFLLGACSERLAGGAGAGNPPLAAVTVSLQAGSAPLLAKRSARTGAAASLAGAADSVLAVPDSAGTVLTLLGIEARVRHLEFDLPQGLSCQGWGGLTCEEGEILVNGPFRADLVNGTTLPEIAPFKLPAGTYTGFGIDFVDGGRNADSSAPWDTALQNLAIRGKVGPAGGMGREFQIQLKLQDGLDFENSAGIRIDIPSANKVRLRLRVDRWFRGIDMVRCLDIAPVGPDGAAQLFGDGVCGGAGRRIRANIESSGEVDEEGEGRGETRD